MLIMKIILFMYILVRNYTTTYFKCRMKSIG